MYRLFTQMSLFLKIAFRINKLKEGEQTSIHIFNLRRTKAKKPLKTRGDSLGPQPSGKGTEGAVSLRIALPTGIPVTRAGTPVVSESAAPHGVDNNEENQDDDIESRHLAPFVLQTRQNSGLAGVALVAQQILLVPPRRTVAVQRVHSPVVAVPRSTRGWWLAAPRLNRGQIILVKIRGEPIYT